MEEYDYSFKPEGKQQPSSPSGGVANNSMVLYDDGIGPIETAREGYDGDCCES